MLRYANVNGCECINRFVVFLEAGESALNAFRYPQDVRGNNCSIYGRLARAAEHATFYLSRNCALSFGFRSRNCNFSTFSEIGARATDSRTLIKIGRRAWLLTKQKEVLGRN